MKRSDTKQASTLIPGLLFISLWLSCLSWSAPRIEAYVHGQALAVIAHAPETRVETHGRQVTLHGANTANGDAALLVKQLRAVSGIDQVIIASVRPAKAVPTFSSLFRGQGVAAQTSQKPTFFEQKLAREAPEVQWPIC